MENKTNFCEEDISELKDGLTPFPEEVFVAEQSWLNDCFLPLISVDLGVLRTDLVGTVVHFLNPVEPADGLLGEETEEFYNEFCAENWIAFKLTTDNKYNFLADKDYFLSLSECDEDLAEHIQTMRDTFQTVKSKYKEKGQLLSWQDYPDALNFIDRLGGEILEGNWTDTVDIPSAFEMNFETPPEDSDSDGISISYQGKELMYVGEVAGYNYCSDGADAIMMFYEPENRIVLFTYDWS